MNRRMLGFGLAATCLGLSALGAGCAPETASETLSETTVYLVRHAEKMTGDDPALTADGQARADALAERLGGVGLTHIHSSDTRRTRDTAAPVAARAGLAVALYDPRDLHTFAERLLDTPGTHLVVGHSNTTPQLAEALGGDGGAPIVEANEYNRLYVLRVADEQTLSTIERFGAPNKP